MGVRCARDLFCCTIMVFDAVVNRVRVQMDVTPRHRDGEGAYVSLNGMMCWATSLSASQGSQQCGGESKFKPRNEEAVPVTGCSITLSGSGNVPLTVRVWTNLDGRNAKEESFGIANIVIQNHEPSRSNRTRCMFKS